MNENEVFNERTGHITFTKENNEKYDFPGKKYAIRFFESMFGWTFVRASKSKTSDGEWNSEAKEYDLIFLEDTVEAEIKEEKHWDWSWKKPKPIKGFPFKTVDYSARKKDSKAKYFITSNPSGTKCLLNEGQTVINAKVGRKKVLFKGVERMEDFLRPPTELADFYVYDEERKVYVPCDREYNPSSTRNILIKKATMNEDLKPWQVNRPVKVEFLVKEHMVQKALSNKREFHYFHPSAWGSCLRKIAYQYYNEQERFLTRTANDIDDRMERIFDNGHGIHHRWQKYLDMANVLRGVWRCPNPDCGKKYGENELIGIFNPSAQPDWECEACGSSKRLEYEELSVKTDPKYLFEGHCDAVIDVSGTKFAQNGPYDQFVLDFKSMKDDMYSELIEPKPEHVIQTNIYMWILNLQGAVVLYENKNSQSVKELFIPRDDELIEKIKAQSIWLQGVLKEKQLPHRPNGFSRSKFPCRFCEFVDWCYK